MSKNKVEEIAILGNGCCLFRERNNAGGYTYYSDEIGGGVMVWDTCLVDEETILTAIADHMKLQKIEYYERENAEKNQQMGLYDDNEGVCDDIA
jgi:hypothetical protein